MTTTPSPALALRESTADHHQRAERSDFQRQFVAGRLPVALYIGWLEQMLLVYRALESHLRSPAGNGRYAAFPVDTWPRSPELERDLRHFGRPGSPAPVPATEAFLDQIAGWATSRAPALLGVLYVLEGSTNGSRYIAKSVRKAYGLDGAGGLEFLDPYGDQQPERWREFKVALDGSIPAEHLPELVETARQTFDAVSAIGGDLLKRAAA